MITLTEEPYDGEVAVALVGALSQDINERYAYAMAHLTEEEQAAEDEVYLAEVEPHHVAHPHGTFIVAWIDGTPAGCGAVKPLAGAAPDHGEVKRMYTAPWARRRGVSRVVLDELERRAVELGYTRLQLETGTAQPEAIALYEASGWQRIPGYGRYKDDPDAISFAKDLVSP